MIEKKQGQVITFYSYKGGTGRTMALANVATLLSRKRKVLAIDWDLEAPGLHYFLKPEEADALLRKPGLIDLFEEIYLLLEENQEWKSDKNSLDVFEKIDIDNYLHSSDYNLFLLAAGRLSEDYPRQIAAFQWEKLFYRAPWIFRSFANFLTDRFDYVLIDSRTGLNDISGVCTSLMPEKLITVFTPSLQSISGVLEAIKSAIYYRKESDDLRPLNIFPLPSRLELQEKELLDAWRFGSEKQKIQGYQPLFEQLLFNLYGLEQCDLETYFDNVQIQQFSYYAYGERIAVSDPQGTGRLSLEASYSLFTGVLTECVSPWAIKEFLESRSPSTLSEEQQSENTILLQNADDAYYSADYDRAIILYSQVLNEAPGNIRATQQRQKAELNKSSKPASYKELPIEAVRSYKRARSFLAANDLLNARKNLLHAIEIANQAGFGFPDASELLKNIDNAFKANTFKTEAFENLEAQQWARAVSNLESAVALDPTDTVVSTLLLHLKALLKAQVLLVNLDRSVSGSIRNSSVLRNVGKILDQTSDSIPLSKLWMEVASQVRLYNNNSSRIGMVSALTTSFVLIFVLWFLYLAPRNQMVVDCPMVAPGFTATINYPVYVAKGDKDVIQFSFTNNSDSDITSDVLLSFDGSADVRLVPPTESNLFELRDLKPNEKISTAVYFTVDGPFQLISNEGDYVLVSFCADASNKNEIQIGVSPIYALRTSIWFLWGAVGMWFILLFGDNIKKTTLGFFSKGK